MGTETAFLRERLSFLQSDFQTLKDQSFGYDLYPFDVGEIGRYLGSNTIVSIDCLTKFCLAASGLRSMYG